MKYRRRKYFIEKQTQSRFILRFVTISLTGGLLAVALFVYLGGKKMDTILYSMVLPDKSAAQLLFREILWINGAILAFISLVLVFTTRKFITTLNGPLRKITADLHRATAGDLTIRTVLRKNDAFRETADEINETIQALHTYFLSLREKTELIQDMAGRKTDADPDELAKEIHELDKISRKFTP